MNTGLLVPDELQGGRGGIWAYVSASRLSCWSRCPLAFKFQYLDGLRPPTTTSLFLGKVVHQGLEVYYRHRQLGVTLAAADVCRRLLESWASAVDEEGMKFQSPAEEQALQRQAMDLVAAYLAHVPADEPKPLAAEVAVEAPLVDPATGGDLGLPLLGVIDLVLDTQSGPVVCDFKTSARSSEPLEIVHEVQLSCYAYLLRHTAEQEEAGLEIRSLVKTKTPKVEFHRYPARTEAHLRRLFSLIRVYLDDLDAGRFVYRPGWTCASCEFATGPCRSWPG
jgi:CRISPR/Cas system-associated exonuclease Cas4 (RecB family)